MSKVQEVIRIIVFFLIMYFLMVAVDVFYYEKYVENYSVLNETYEQIKEKEKAYVVMVTLKLCGLLIVSTLCFGSKLAKLSKKKSSKPQ